MKSVRGRGTENLEITDFSGGLVTKSPPKNIDKKHSVDCQDVYAEGAILRKRLGITVLNPTAQTGAGNGLYNWIRGSNSTNQWLVSFSGDTLAKMDITAGVWDGTWDTISAHTGSGTAFSASTMYFANFNGVLLMSTDSWNEIQRITTSEASHFDVLTGGSGTAPQAKFVINWNNHAWYGNVNGSEDNVVHSSINSYNNFTGSLYGTNTLFTENDIGLTGGFIFGKSLYWTKAFSMHRFTYTGSPNPLVDIKHVETNIGTKSPRTIKKVITPEGQRVLFLGSNKKLYLFDGYEPLEISDQVDVTNNVATVYMQNINESRLKECFAEVHFDLNWYELFLCIGTATTPNYSLVYDYRYKSFWPMTNRNFSYSAMADNGSGKKVVYVQGATNGVTYLTNSTNSDNGTAINGVWVSEKIGKPIILNKVDELEVETEAVACTPTFSWRGDWETTWISQTMASNTNSHNWSPNRNDNMMQFMIQDNSTNASFKLWSITGSERALGGGK